jgi:YD repeat-containing protein
MKGLMRTALLGLALFNAATFADKQRDYYAEPGLNPFATASGQDVTENIDPFSGNLNLRYVDLMIPGNGGLDITVLRSYNLPQEAPGYVNPFGYGWTIHFGRILTPASSVADLCGGPQVWGSGDTNNNPSIEMPDGGRELLVQSSALGEGYFITKTNWLAQCVDFQGGDHTQGMLVTAPNGTKYHMTKHAFMQGTVPAGEENPITADSWYTTKIEDLDGNYIDITYDTLTSGWVLPKTLNASDGRSVEFNYLVVGANATLDTIVANNQTWTYSYDSDAPGGDSGWQSISFHKLTQVLRPDGSAWNYEYGDDSASPGWRLIDKVTYPFGGVVDYQYEYLQPYTGYGVGAENVVTVGIKKKTQTNGSLAAGEWDYSYYFDGNVGGSVVTMDGLGFVNPISEVPLTGRPVAVTQIETPVGIERVYHVGYWTIELEVSGYKLSQWVMGLNIGHDYYEKDGSGGLGNLLRNTRTGYEPRLISLENFRGGQGIAGFDSETYAPQILETTESVRALNDSMYIYRTTYSDYDDYGNPQLVKEHGAGYPAVDGVEPDKFTQHTYFNDTSSSKWIIGLPGNETVIEGVDVENGVVVNQTTRTYWPNNGRLQSETINGVQTSYAYHLPGDPSAGSLKKVTNALDRPTEYLDYHRGIARQEKYPDSTWLIRTVNDTGTVESQTPGHPDRALTTSFTYDNMNRLKTITFPEAGSTPVSDIQWNSNSKVLTRGNYSETVEWDGFGRDIQVTRQDTGPTTPATVVQTFAYDAMGRKYFESDLSAAPVATGITYEFDAIGRTTKITDQNNKFRRIEYDAANRELHYDEKDQLTEKLYTVWGGASNRFLLATFMDQEGLLVSTPKDATGRIRSVAKLGNAADPNNPDDGISGNFDDYAGYQQAYHYDTHWHLNRIQSPHDIGDLHYTPDILGNVKERWVNGSPKTHFDYDEMNRLKFINYPDDSPTPAPDVPDVTYAYYDDGLVQSITASNSSRSYEYDDNGNLWKEHVGIGNIQAGVTPYTTVYDTNSLDHVTKITYPSERFVEYAPDALGRPTEATPFATSVSHHPNGAIHQIAYDNGITTTYTQTPRKFVDTITSSGNLINLDYGYDFVGNVLTIVDSVDSSSRTNTYDGLNRLATTIGSWGSAAEYGYNAFNNFSYKRDPANGNRLQSYAYLSGYAGTNYGSNLSKLRSIFYWDTLTARFFSHDQYGNIQESDEYDLDLSQTPAVPVGMPISERDYVFNDANQLIEHERIVRDSSGNVLPLLKGHFTNEYDGKGNRIKKTNLSQNNEVTEYVYSDTGQLFGEYDANGAPYGLEYIYLGAQQIATAKTNAPPVVSLGEDLEAIEGEQVFVEAVITDLDSDYDPATISWSSVPGSIAVTFDDPSSASTSFYIPAGSKGQTIQVQFTVADIHGESGEPQILNITVPNNTSPVADAGPDRTVLVGDSVQLDGSASNDAEGDLTFLWVGLYLDDPTLKSPTVNVPEGTSPGTLTYTLIVEDEEGLTDPDTVTVTIFDLGSDSDDDDLPDGWELQYFPTLAAAAGTDDPDGDGVSNTQEFIDGSNPKVANSPEFVALLAVKRGDGRNHLVWAPSKSAIEYLVYWSADDTLPLAEWSEATTEERYFDHLSLTNGIEQFYRVVAQNTYASSSPSPIVSGSPNAYEWKDQIYLPPELQTLEKSGLAGVDSGRVSIATNSLDDTVLVKHGVSENGDNQLHAWFRSPFEPWSGPVVVANYESTSNQEYLESAIDNEGNVLVAWVSDWGTGTERNLVAAYGRRGEGFESKQVLDDWSGSNSNLRDIGAIGFSGEGDAFICWTQERLLTINGNSILNEEATRARRFDAQTGWDEIRTLELNNSIGYNFNLDCKVSQQGEVIAIWTRDVEYNPPSQGGDDVYIAAYEPGSGWSQTSSISDLINGTPLSGNAGNQYGHAIAMDDNDHAGILYWPKPASGGVSADSIQFVEYTFSSAGVSSPQILDSDPYSGSPLIINYLENGDLLALSHLSYWIRPGGSSNWGPLEQVPEVPSYFSASATGSLEIAATKDHTDARVYSTTSSNWSWHQFDPNNDNAYKSIFDATGQRSGALRVIRTVQSLGDDVNVLVADNEPGNSRPFAIVSDDQSVEPGTVVQIDGSDSYDPDGSIASYSWSKVSGPTVTLGDTAQPQLSFTAPSVAMDEDLILRLVVTDNEGDSSQIGGLVTITIDGPNVPPTADAGTAFAVIEGDTNVSLDGSGSSDPDGEIATYSWTQIGTPEAPLLNDNTATPTFTAPNTGQNELLTFELTVADDEGDSNTSQINVIIYSYTDSDDFDYLGDAWEFFYFGDLDEIDGGDYDNDGGTNTQEFVAGTDPTVVEDADSDGVSDWVDNCPDIANPLQEDDDNNDIGNACEGPVGC